MKTLTTVIFVKQKSNFKEAHKCLVLLLLLRTRKCKEEIQKVYCSEPNLVQYEVRGPAKKKNISMVTSSFITNKQTEIWCPLIWLHLYCDRIEEKFWRQKILLWKSQTFICPWKGSCKAKQFSITLYFIPSPTQVQDMINKKIKLILIPFTKTIIQTCNPSNII